MCLHIELCCGVGLFENLIWFLYPFFVGRNERETGIISYWIHIVCYVFTGFFMCELNDLCIILVFSIFVVHEQSHQAQQVSKTKYCWFCAPNHCSKYVYISPRVTGCPLFYSDGEEIVEIPTTAKEDSVGIPAPPKEPEPEVVEIAPPPPQCRRKRWRWHPDRE